MAQNEVFAETIEGTLGGFAAATGAARARNIVQIISSKDGHRAYHDCMQLSGTDSNEILTSVVAWVNNSAINQSEFFAAHCGVARIAHHIVAIPALSGHGKTTLTAALVRAGFDYLSDEALVFDDDGSVVPYPKPFALSEWSAEKLGVAIQGEETLATASDLGGKVGQGGKLTDLILSEYGHEDITLEPLPKSQAVAALIQYSFNHYKDPARAFRIATDVARDLNVWRLEYDDPIEAAEVISNTLR